MGANSRRIAPVPPQVHTSKCEGRPGDEIEPKQPRELLDVPNFGVVREPAQQDAAQPAGDARRLRSRRDLAEQHVRGEFVIGRAGERPLAVQRLGTPVR